MNNLHIPLNDDELQELDEFLLQRGRRLLDDPDERDIGIIDVSELDGFFTAIVSGPETIMPSRWLPTIWGHAEPEWESEAAFYRIMELFMRHMSGIVSSLMEPDFHFEPFYLEQEIDGEMVTLVDSWCVGYLRGYSLAQEGWANADDEVMDYLETILLFAHENSREASDEYSREELIEMRESIPTLARAIHSYWLEWRENSDYMRTPHKAPRVGRNDPCPCGSGRKYKKCCLH